VRALLASSPLADAPILPVSAHTGEGMATLRETLATQGTLEPPPRRGHFRLAIDRSFTVRGAGVVVTGTAVAGNVRLDDELVALPAGARVRVRGLRAADLPVDVAGAGERVAVNVSGVERDAVARGHWLAAPAIARTSERLDVRLKLLADGALPRSGADVYVHHGAAHRLARLVELSDGPGEDAVQLVGLNLREPLHALHGDRVVLRDAAAQRTLGGGRVLDPFPPKRGRRRPEHRERLQALREIDPEAVVAALLQRAPLGVSLADLAATLNLDASQLAALAERPGRMRRDRGGTALLIDAEAWRELRADITAQIDRWHDAHPQLAGPRFDQLRAVLSIAPDEAQLRLALRELIDAGEVVQDAAFIRRPQHVPRLAGSDEPLWERIRPLLADSPTRPPVVHALAAELGLEPATVEALLQRAAHAGHVLRVATNRFLLPEGVRRLADLAAETAARAPEGRFDVRAFRDHSGIGRNLSVDVLEYFDRMGLTRRLADERILVREPAEVFGN